MGNSVVKEGVKTESQFAFLVFLRDTVSHFERARQTPNTGENRYL